MEHFCSTYDLKKNIENFKCGDIIYLTGDIYTSRDAAHKRIFSLLEKKDPLPYDINNAVIYYAGPTGTRPGNIIGSCGPTTSSRMDVYAPKLLDLGLCAMIGKGERNKAVVDAIIRNKAAYLCAIGGAGALCAKSIKKCNVIAFEDLGCESVKKLYVEDFPLIVAVDCFGNDIFKNARKFFKEDNI